MKVLILGGNATGMSVASKLKRNNQNIEVQVIESTEVVSFGNCGLPYFIGGYFNDEDYMIAKDISKFKESGIKINLNTRVLMIDFIHKNVTVCTNKKDIEKIKYDKLVIATGSLPILPNKFTNIRNVFTLKTLLDAKNIMTQLENLENQNISILGGGYIGVEMLDVLLEKYPDKKFYLIEGKKSILPMLDEEMVEPIIKQLKSYKNLEIIVNEFVDSIVVDEENNIKSVKTNQRSLKTDMMICSIGVNPNVDFLEKSVFLNEKIATLEKGAILINNKGETNLEDVYSGGDCASVFHKVLGKDVYIPLATTANKIGRMIADSICEKENNFEGTIGSSSLKVCGFEVAKAGISEQEAILNNIAYKKISFEDYNHTNYYPNQQKIYIKILFNPENFEILGAQMVGKDGVALRMHVFSLAIIKKISIKEFGNMDFGYSPPFSRVYDILNIAGNLAK